MTISSGDKAIMLNSADGTQTPHFMSSDIASGDKFILTQTADGALVPMNVSTDVADSDKCFMALTADGSLVPVQGSPNIIYWVVLDSKQVRNWAGPAEGSAAEELDSGNVAELFCNLTRPILNGKSGLMTISESATTGSSCTIFHPSISPAMNSGSCSCTVSMYGISSVIDLPSLTWSNKPSGTLISQTTLVGAFTSSQRMTQITWKNPNPYSNLIASGLDVRAVRFSYSSVTVTAPGTYTWEVDYNTGFVTPVVYQADLVA